MYGCGFLDYETVDAFTDRGLLIGYNMQFRNNWGFEINVSGGPRKDQENEFDAFEATFSSWFNTSPRWRLSVNGGYAKTYNFSRDYLAFYSWLESYVEWNTTSFLELGTSLDVFIGGNPSNSIEDITYNARPFLSITTVNDLNVRMYFDLVSTRSSQQVQSTILGFLFSYNFLPMGYMFLHLPASMMESGKPVRMKVVGESAGSRTWFMTFKYETVASVKLVADNAILRTDEGNRQILRTEIVYYGDTLEAEVEVGSQKFERQIGFGYQSHQIPVPEIKRDTTIAVKITAGLERLCDTVFTIRPVPYRTIYLLHHSHNDIGYTHVQNEVEEMQWKNLADAVKLAEETKDFPEGARFKWNVEVLWAVDSYLKQASPEKQQQFVDAVKAGQVGLQALYGNQLTGLCHPEELLRLLGFAQKLSDRCGVPINSAMITDVRRHRRDEVHEQDRGLHDQAGDQEAPTGRERLPQIEPTKIEFPNITGTISLEYADKLLQWHEDYVRKGRSDPKAQKTGSIEFLSPQHDKTIFNLNMYEISITSLQVQASQANQDAIKRVKFELYVGRMDLDGKVGLE